MIDPIDGTLRFYLEGRGPYAVMIGLARDARVRGRAGRAAARRALPRRRARPGRAHRAAAAAPPRAARAAATGKRVYVSHDLPEAAHESLLRRGFEVATACGGAIAVAPLVPGACAGLRIAAGARRRVSRSAGASAR